jgi:ligand-binding sensor domain-containing protein
MKKTTQLILYILVSFLTANANNFRFHHLTSENGLPHQQAETLLQDEKGYIWIGTRNGLSRYDGYSFENYFHDSNNPHSLCNNFIKKLFIDHKNRVWVCTVDGVCRYRPATNDFKRYDNLKGEFQAAVVANNGKIYLGNTQLSVYDEKAD